MAKHLADPIIDDAPTAPTPVPASKHVALSGRAGGTGPTSLTDAASRRPTTPPSGLTPGGSCRG